MQKRNRLLYIFCGHACTLYAWNDTYTFLKTINFNTLCTTGSTVYLVITVVAMLFRSCMNSKFVSQTMSVRHPKVKYKLS